MLYYIIRITGIVLLAGVSVLLGFIVYKAITTPLSVRIGARNLVRQFRRNLLLGIGMSVGMSILIITTSFTNGLTDIIFNKVMVYMTGHIRVEMQEYTSKHTTIIRDEPRVLAAIKSNVQGIKSIEPEVSTFARTIGNGKTGMAMLVGIPEDSAFVTDTNFEEGNARDLYKKDVFPGIVLYKNSAKELNVKLNDIITVRFDTIYGQSQAPKFKVVGLLPSENMFMDMAAFTDMKTIREMLNLNDAEVLGINVVTEYPEDRAKISRMADKLYEGLKPGTAGISAVLDYGALGVKARVFALKVTTGDDSAKAALGAIKFVSGDIASLTAAKNGLVLSKSLASKLGSGLGAKLVFRYDPKYSKDAVEQEAVVAGIMEDPTSFDPMTAFANEQLFYDTYFKVLPATVVQAPAGNTLAKALVPEWRLLDRSKDTDSFMKKRTALNREHWKGAVADVETMYETASAIVDFQVGLNIISVVAVFILFFVILIGVVNTMRMSIRERTREIGTNRAIGMQSSDVAWVFIFEIVLLSFFACCLGIALGFGGIAALSSITVSLTDNSFSMFFVNKHPYFVPTLQAVYLTFGVIISISFFIALASSRKAAKMRVADALRHYE